jgi:hypothetical protein
MSDQPTPETDAAQFGTGRVSVEFARRLERERDEAREEIDDIRKTLSESGEAIGNGVHNYSIIEMVENIIQSKNYFIKKSDSAERERDEAREKCAALGKAISYSPEATTLLGKFLQATKERDETKLAFCSLAKQFESDIQKANAMAEKAKALIDRWDKPSWKDTAPTAGFIYALRSAVEDYEKTLK